MREQRKKIAFSFHLLLLILILFRSTWLEEKELFWPRKTPCSEKIGWFLWSNYKKVYLKWPWAYACGSKEKAFSRSWRIRYEFACVFSFFCFFPRFLEFFSSYSLVRSGPQKKTFSRSWRLWCCFYFICLLLFRLFFSFFLFLLWTWTIHLK